MLSKSIRDEIMNPRRAKWWLIGALTLAAVFFVSNYLSARKVIDGTTKQPLADVYVILTFAGDFFAGVESRHQCYRLDVEKTDADGRFHFPLLHGGANLLQMGAQVSVRFYKAGYRTSEQVPMSGEPFVMVPDTRVEQEQPLEKGPPPVSGLAMQKAEGRNSDLQSLIYSATHCGGGATARSKDLQDVFVAMYNEVRSKEKVDWGFINNLLYEIEGIEHRRDVGMFGSTLLGPESERYDKRKEELRFKSPDVGKGPLWALPEYRGSK